MEQQQEDKIRRFLETFFKATQIEALYFDRQLNMISCHCRRFISEDFPRLSMGGIEEFLKELFQSGAASQKHFYTYYLHQNLIFNICLLREGGECVGAAVTQPVLLNVVKRPEAEAKLSAAITNAAERDEYLSALERVPVVSHDRIRSIGEVLGALSVTVFAETAYYQEFCGGDAPPALYEFYQTGKCLNRRPTPTPADRHTGYPAYCKIKEAILKGDAGALLKMADSFDTASIHVDQQTSRDAVRSLKNGFIEGLGMYCFIAVEAGVPYNKARELNREFIRELESTENVADMYRLMKSAAVAFARAVAVTHIIGYSKPVRMVLEYIETHFAEKITLKILAREANLSEFYLSNLIKKETGLNIADLINRVRIEESKKILVKSAVSIGELASMVGYSYSNHFSKVFKQQTGMTPSAYLKMMAISSDEASDTKNILRMLLDQLSHNLGLFPGVFDVVRIVDPIANRFWMLQAATEITEGTCYDFWNRKKSCEACISRMALEQGKPFVKLDQGDGGPFFVFTTPMLVGGKKYVIELLKSVSENYFDCVAAYAGS